MGAGRKRTIIKMKKKRSQIKAKARVKKAIAAAKK